MRTLRTFLLAGLVAGLAVACSGGSRSPSPVGPDDTAGSTTPGAPVTPTAPRTTRYDAKSFFETTAVRGMSFSHDGSRVLVSTDATGVFNVYAVPVDGSAPTQLTKSTTSARLAVSYFPKDDRFLFTGDQGGNELHHVYVMEADGTEKDLTPGDKLKAGFVDWSGDQKQFYVQTNERDPKAFDLYRYETDGYARKLVFENKDNWTLSDVSPDGKWLALVKVKNNVDSDIYLVELGKKGAKPKLITKHEGDVQHQPFSFTRDSKRLYYGTNGQGEFAQAWSYDLKSGKHASEIVDEWDVMYVFFSEHGAYRASATNVDAKTVLRVTDTKTGNDLSLPELPAGDVVSVNFSNDEKVMGFYLLSETSSQDLWVLDLSTNQPKRLTNTMNPKIEQDDLVEGAVVRYPSYDDLQIPAILYRPKDASPQNKVPALVMVHGGPGGQSRLGYNPMIQHLVNHGYAVINVNNRGSSGYGKTFFHMDDRKHGDVDLKDCVWARRYLSGLDWVDGSRVGIIGGSYGGYMVAAALAFEPDAFDVGIDIFGVTNWVRTLESIPAWWTAQRDALYAEMGDPAKDKERLTAISPLFHASKIKKPLLVVQGANDPRVLKVESDEIVAAVKKNGVPVEYVVFPDEGHGFMKRDNRITAQEAYLKFLETHLATKSQ